jgi:hypothetical protein
MKRPAALSFRGFSLPGAHYLCTETRRYHSLNVAELLEFMVPTVSSHYESQQSKWGHGAAQQMESWGSRWDQWGSTADGIMGQHSRWDNGAAQQMFVGVCLK